MTNPATAGAVVAVAGACSVPLATLARPAIRASNACSACPRRRLLSRLRSRHVERSPQNCRTPDSADRFRLPSRKRRASLTECSKSYSGQPVRQRLYSGGWQSRATFVVFSGNNAVDISALNVAAAVSEVCVVDRRRPLRCSTPGSTTRRTNPRRRCLSVRLRSSHVERCPDDSRTRDTADRFRPPWWKRRACSSLRLKHNCGKPVRQPAKIIRFHTARDLDMPKGGGPAQAVAQRA